MEIKVNAMSRPFPLTVLALLLEQSLNSPCHRSHDAWRMGGGARVFKAPKAGLRSRWSLPPLVGWPVSWRHVTKPVPAPEPRKVTGDGHFNRAPENPMMRNVSSLLHSLWMPRCARLIWWCCRDVYLLTVVAPSLNAPSPFPDHLPNILASSLETRSLSVAGLPSAMLISLQRRRAHWPGRQGGWEILQGVPPRSEIEGGISPGNTYPVFQTRFAKWA